MTDYLKRRVVVNSSKSLETLKYPWRRLWRSSLVQIILQHDSVRLYISGATEEVLENLKTEPISQLPYSPNLVSCDPLFSRETSRVIITPQTMMWRQQSDLGLGKCWERISVMGLKKCLRVGKNMLYTTVTMLKNRYMILK